MINFEINKNYYGFKLEKQEFVEDINSDCYVFCHEKSGARLFYAKNEDKNKVFFISFKTPPENSCGTAHIMEHSVLCGSEKYPVKDPFNELEKGSLKTYLNALTYSDKTMYPVASCNDKDFENLVRVYVDAVFKPNVLKEEKLFMQEGWHYELEDKDSELIYNGVVYNEMKGALSQPERMLMNCASKSLFGNSTYGYESGGDPEFIPDLTYDDFKAFYNKFYYPSNSFIYLYGDMDIEKYMAFLSDEYLNDYENSGEKIEIKEITNPSESYMEEEYSVLEDDEKGKDSFFALNYCLSKSTDILMQYAFDVLCYALFDTNGSPIKNALIESRICEDAEGWFDYSSYQMTLSIVGKKCRFDDKEKFREVVENELKNIAENGIDKELFVSALNSLEFMIKEADFGYKPKGLYYGMKMMYGYLHGQDPVESIRIWKYLDKIREGIETGFFEEIIKKYFLSNPHSSFVVIKGKKGLQAELDEKLRDKLSKYKESLSTEEIENIIKQTKELEDFQDSKENEEDLKKIPYVSVDEIDKKAGKIELKETSRGLEIINKVNDIVYFKLIFSLDVIPEEKIPYAALLSGIVGKMDTEKFSYESLNKHIDLYTGGIYADIDDFEGNGIKPSLCINGKCIERNEDKIFDLFNEVTVKTRFDKLTNLEKIIREIKLNLENAISENGHSYSVLRALSKIKKASAFKEIAKGITYTDFLSKAEKNIENTAKILEETAKIIFNKDNVFMARLSPDGESDKCNNLFDNFKNSLFDGKKEVFDFDFEPKYIKEAVTNDSKVVYNALAGDFLSLGFEYSGAMNVVKNIINTEFLWNQVRVKGGAYGSGCAILRNGNIYAYSYRDPNTVKTFGIYNDIAEFLRNFAEDNQDMSKFILGAINEIDKPKSGAEIMEASVLRYFGGITQDMLQKSRTQILNTDKEDILYCADIFDAVYKKCACVSIGSENIIKKDESFYDNVRRFSAGE